MTWIRFLLSKYLKAPKKRGVRWVLRFAVLAVGLGVATLTLTQSVLSGFEAVFREAILGFNAHLVVLKHGEMSQIQKEMERIQPVLAEEVLAHTPFLYREGLLMAHGKIKGGVLKGIDPLTFSKVYDVKVNSLGQGQASVKIEDLLQIQGEYPGILLGKDLAENLKIKDPGETVKIFLPKSQTSPEKKDQFQVFTVLGTFSSGLHEYDRGFAFANLSSLQEIFEVPGQATGIEFSLAHPMEASQLAEKLRDRLGMGYETLSWEELNGPLFKALRLERAVFFIVMSLVVVVAAFNIVGLLLLLIFERTREISILRALGADLKGLKRLFTYQGIAIGFVGGGLGLLMGVGIAAILKRGQWLKLAKEVYLIEELPIKFSVPTLLLVVAACLIILWVASRFAVSRINKCSLDL